MKFKSNPPLTILSIVFGLLFVNFFLEQKLIFFVCLFISSIGVFSSRSSKFIEKIWYKLSFYISQIIPNILLIIIFYLILTPIALLSKIFKTSSNFLSKDQSKTAYKNQIKQFDKKSFERAW
tara:strand:+ start:55 stop:420 length:366 start_codon:yes stop_codon:yes gene_type:complete